MNQKRPTVLDVAARAGVSRSTVSLVLQGNQRISQATRAAVIDAMEQIGYQYNRNAANFRRQTSQIIGFVTHDVRNPYFAEMAAGVEVAAAEEGFLMQLACTYEDIARQTRIIDVLAEQNVAGIILCSAPDTGPSEIFRIKTLNIPTVLAIRSVRQETFDFVGPDNLRASTLAARYLIGLGHTRISFIGGEASNPTRSDRIRGYADALADAGLEFRPSLVGAPVKELDRASGIEWLLAHPERPTAVLCFNDVVAISLNKQLHECGLLAGRDLSIVGFDDTRDARMAYPLLSTVALHPSKIGEMAFQLLSKRISDRSAPLQKIMIVPDFVERDSSRPLLGSSAGDIHRTQSAAGTLPGAEARIAAASSDVETGNFSGGEPGTIC